SLPSTLTQPSSAAQRMFPSTSWQLSWHMLTSARARRPLNQNILTYFFQQSHFRYMALFLSLSSRFQAQPQSTHHPTYSSTTSCILKLMAVCVLPVVGAQKFKRGKSKK